MINADRPGRRIVTGYLIVVAIVAICAITATFLVTGSLIDAETKTRGFLAIIAAFLAFCGVLYLIEHRRTGEDARPMSDISACSLDSLDDIGGLLAGCLSTKDVFRLVASRVRAVLPAKTVALYLLDKSRQRLERSEFDGNGSELAASAFNIDTCFVKREIQVSDGGAVAIPLTNNGEPFAVLELGFGSGGAPCDRSIFDEIATRVSPLILNALAFERSAANALTDATTDLPNERALYLILENQIAETQRKPDERPLTLLAMDIRGFYEINERFGHTAGDRVLNFVAQTVRDSLRQMDFLARCRGDEFLAVLPTASKEMSREIQARISTSLFGRTLDISDDASMEAELNFGAATFGEDGETAAQLIAAAKLRKEGRKHPRAGKVLWFSREMTV